MRIIIYIYLFFFALFLSLSLVPLAKKFAFRYKIIDNPGKRKVHTTPKPYLGGIAIYLSFVTVILFNIIIYYIIKDNPFFQNRFQFLVLQYPLFHNILPKLIAVLFGGTIIVTIGLIDDIKGVEFSPLLKLLAQAFVAFFAVSLGIKTSFFPYFFDIFLAITAKDWVLCTFVQP